MRTLELVILKALNGLGESTVIYEAAGYVTDYASAIVVGLFAFYLIVHTGEPGRMRRSLVLAAFCGLLALMVVGVADYFGMVRRPRPFVVLPPDQVELRLPEINDSSFPSTLTTVTAAIATATWYAPGKTARWVFMTVAVWAGVSRPMMGLNWPSDIVGSALLGWLLARAIVRGARPSSPLRSGFLWACGWIERWFSF